jgi:hypothetical protein
MVILRYIFWFHRNKSNNSLVSSSKFFDFAQTNKFTIEDIIFSLKKLYLSPNEYDQFVPAILNHNEFSSRKLIGYLTKNAITFC